jgi:hypothetical protein
MKINPIASRILSLSQSAVKIINWKGFAERPEKRKYSTDLDEHRAHSGSDRVRMEARKIGGGE